MRARRYFLLALLAAIAAAVSFIPPAGAVARDGIKVTRSHPVMEKTYPALIGTTPNSGTGMTNWYTCSNTHRYCDTVRLDIDPEGATFYLVKATLTWPNPRTEQNATGNDLALGIWEPDPTIVYCCRNSRTTGATDFPEEALVTTDNPEPSTFMFVIDNAAGVNQGYTIKVELVEIDQPTAEELRRRFSKDKGAPASTSSSGSTTTRSPSRPAGPNLTLDDIGGPEATPRVIKVPGPDGEIIEIELPVLAAGARERVETGGPGPLAAAGVAAAIVAVGGGGTWWFLRRRRTASA